MEAAGLFEEKVTVLNCNNGERLETYIIKGSIRIISLNGPPPAKCQVGDIVIILAYAHLTWKRPGSSVPR